MRAYSKEEIVECYDEAIIKIAEFVSNLEWLRQRFEWISDYTQDNADPEIEASSVLEKLGVLLSTIIIYKNEILKEDDKKDVL